MGFVPLNRICINPTPGSATEADVLRLAERENKRLFELVDATLVEKAMGTGEAYLGLRLGRLLGNFVDDQQLGIVIGGDGPFRFGRPATSVFQIVSFVPMAGRLPGEGNMLGEKPFGQLLFPTLAVESAESSRTPLPEIDPQAAGVLSTVRLQTRFGSSTRRPRAAEVYHFVRIA